MGKSRFGGKKRRSTRSTVRQRNNTFKRWNPKPDFGDKTVKQHWDVKKTYRQNMANLGLTATANDDVLDKLNNESDAIKIDNIPQDEETIEQHLIAMFGTTSKQRFREKHPLTQTEEKYIAKCMAKYGTDYNKMFRDVKINDYQYTEKQLKKWGDVFLRLTPEQRTIPVPEKVKHLVVEQEASDKDE